MPSPIVKHFADIFQAKAHDTHTSLPLPGVASNPELRSWKAREGHLWCFTLGRRLQAVHLGGSFPTSALCCLPFQEVSLPEPVKPPISEVRSLGDSGREPGEGRTEGDYTVSENSAQRKLV